MRHLAAAALVVLAGAAFALPYAIVTAPSYPMTPWIENCPGEVKQVSLELAGFESIDGIATLVDPRVDLRIEGGPEYRGLRIDRVLDSKFGDEIFGRPAMAPRPIQVYVELPAGEALHGARATLVVTARYEYPSVVAGDRFEVREGLATREFPFTFEPASRSKEAQTRRFEEEKREYERRGTTWRTVEQASLAAGALAVLAALLIEVVGAFRARRS